MESAVCREASRKITMLSFVPLWALEDAIDYLYMYFVAKYKELRKTEKEYFVILKGSSYV